MIGILIIVILGFYINATVWVNEKGEEEKGFSAIQKLKEASVEWSGPLTEDRIAQVINENERINETHEAQSEDTRHESLILLAFLSFSMKRKMGFEP